MTQPTHPHLSDEQKAANLLDEWAEAAGLRFVSRNAGQMTTSTVARNDLLQLIRAARLTTPPAAAEAPTVKDCLTVAEASPVHALIAKWRNAADHLGLEGLASLADCADELEAALAAQPKADSTERTCNNSDCGWGGSTDRMLGSIGPLCPKCGETTEAVNPASAEDQKVYESIADNYFKGNQASAQAGEVSDAEILALNAGERFFSESPTKYPEAGHGTQYHAGAPGVIAFARAILALRPKAQPLTAADKKLIGWRSADYTMETADPQMAKNWSGNIEVLPIFEGDPNTKLGIASPTKGEL